MFRTPVRRRRATRASVVAAVMAATAALVPTSGAQASVPLGNLPGWTQVFHDDFSHGLNTSVWGRYDGQPGGDPYGYFKSSHVKVSANALRIQGYRENGRFITGGLMLNRPQTYGKWMVRAAFARGTGIEQILMLWPTQGWPPELDFAEGSAHGRTMATSHWSSTNQQAHYFASVDQRLYHTYGVEWTPTEVRFTLDGKVFGTVTGAGVPHQPMKLAMQTQANVPVGPITLDQPKAVNQSVAWVSVYRYH